MMLSTTDKIQQNTWNIPRLVIGAPQGRCGKTTFTLGLLRALSRMGMKVQPFKKGPDFIDPSWHTAAAGRLCRNLDAYFMNHGQIRQSLLQGSNDCDISIIEGAMGLYDGLDLAGSSSTAEIAKVTSSPVILVIDCTRMTRSAAAMVTGYQHFDPDVKIAGIVLNKVARPRHEKIMREAIEQFCNIPVLGAVPKDSMIAIPDRHLGLVTQGEMEEISFLLNYLSDMIKEHIDLNKIKDIADTAPELTLDLNKSSKPEIVRLDNRINRIEINTTPRIGVVQDKAFSFYYPENIEALKNYGAEIVPINALADAHLPMNIDALYIGGGFPEVFAQELQQNESLREHIHEVVETYMPVYAECGGLMYLGRSILVAGKSYQMVGALPFDTVMEKKPQGHGYTLMEADDNQWFSSEEIIKGHEFHNSRLVNLASETRFAFKVKKGYAIDGMHDGIVYKNVLASYNHIHAIGCPLWAERFVQLAVEFKNAKAKSRGRVAGE